MSNFVSSVSNALIQTFLACASIKCFLIRKAKAVDAKNVSIEKKKLCFTSTLIIYVYTRFYGSHSTYFDWQLVCVDEILMSRGSKCKNCQCDFMDRFLLLLFLFLHVVQMNDNKMTFVLVCLFFLWFVFGLFFSFWKNSLNFFFRFILDCTMMIAVKPSSVNRFSFICT